MIDQIPMPAWSCRPDGTTEFLNQRWLDYTGLSMEQTLGWGWKVTIHPDDQGTLMDAWLRIFPSEEPGQAEARIRRFDGAYQWFLLCAVPVRNERDEVVRWYGTNTDIEELKRVEDQLRRDNRELRQIIDAIPQAVAVLAPDGSERSGNESVLEYSGFSLGEFQMGNLRALHPDDLERVRDEVHRGLARGVAFQLENRRRGKDGRYRWFLVHYRPLRDEQGDIVRWYVTGIDIEEQKQAEDGSRTVDFALRAETDCSSMFEEVVGCSEPLRKVLWQV